MGTTLSLTPANYTIELVQGVDSVIEFQILRGGLPVDITNDTIDFTARDGYGGTVTIATKQNLPGQHTDPTNGKTVFLLSRTDTRVVGSEGYDVRWVYEVRRIMASSGYQMVHISGDLVLKAMVGTSS